MDIFETLINGPSYGGTDGMDIDGTNIYVHDCQVHNGDECVTMKSGTKNALVERIFCDGTGNDRMMDEALLPFVQPRSCLHVLGTPTISCHIMCCHVISLRWF